MSKLDFCSSCLLGRLCQDENAHPVRESEGPTGGPDLPKILRMKFRAGFTASGAPVQKKCGAPNI